MNVKLLSVPEYREEALKILGVSSPLQLPQEHVFVSLVVVAKGIDITILKDIQTKKVDEQRYILSGSIKDWKKLFLSNPKFDLDPFFSVLSPVLKVKKEGETWMSR